MDLENDDDFALTTFDEFRLQDLEVDGKLEGESGNFTVHRFTKGYLLTLSNEKLIRQKKEMKKEFFTLNGLLRYLKA